MSPRSSKRSASAGRLFLIDWDDASAAARGALLRTEGWSVAIEREDGGRAYRRIRERAPDIVLVDLTSKPSHGREIIRSLTKTKTTRALPIVVIGGSKSEQKEITTLAPQAIFSSPQSLSDALAKAKDLSSTDKEKP
jgi:DNA-binding response OmpR family regulator